MPTLCAMIGDALQPSTARDIPCQPWRALYGTNMLSSVPMLAHNGRRTAGVQLVAQASPRAVPKPSAPPYGPGWATIPKPEIRSLASHISR